MQYWFLKLLCRFRNSSHNKPLLLVIISIANVCCLRINMSHAFVAHLRIKCLMSIIILKYKVKKVNYHSDILSLGISHKLCPCALYVH